MNHINLKFTILLFILLFTQNTWSQIKVPKKANTIIIEKTGSADSLIWQYVHRLIEKGYLVDYDKDLRMVKTEFKPLERSGMANLKISAFAKQVGEKAIMEVKGLVEVTNLMMSSPILYDSCNCGLSRDARKVSFEEIKKTLVRFGYDKAEFVVK